MVILLVLVCSSELMLVMVCILLFIVSGMNICLVVWCIIFSMVVFLDDDVVMLRKVNLFVFFVL